MMLNWSCLFLTLTLITGALGFGFLDGPVAAISQALALLFFVLMIGSVIHREIQRRRRE
ncbi:MAG: DUF1328 domain-containing protein [Verrucomicrobiota bacterium]